MLRIGRIRMVLIDTTLMQLLASRIWRRRFNHRLKQPFRTFVLYPFLKNFKANAQCVMCSYNSVNGIPACAHDKLLNDVLRSQWGFNGHIVSDSGAILDIWAHHNYTKTPEKACEVAIKGGCDLNAGKFFIQHLKDTFEKGLVNLNDLKLAAGRMVLNRFKLGEFDDWDSQPYRKLGEEVIDTKESRDLALLLAQESLVLLKNEAEVLPLDPKVFKKIAVIGPAAKDVKSLQGDPWYSIANPPYLITAFDGIKSYGVEVLYNKGCDYATEEETIEEAIEISKQSDAVILCMGLGDKNEHETQDRNRLYFPGQQANLIRSIFYSVDVPIVLLVSGASPIDVSFSKENLDAIIFTGYPGQSGGKAIADVIFGAHNPAGKLTVTVYPEKYADQCDMTEMTMRPSKNCPNGRTYKFYNGTPIYKFGDGLSYTTFSYSWIDDKDIRLSKEEIQDHKSNSFVVKVKNSGNRDGDHVILAYIRNSFNPDAPLKQLLGFKRVDLKFGEVKEVVFELTKENFEYVSKRGERIIENGKYEVIVGDLVKIIHVY